MMWAEHRGGREWRKDELIFIFFWTELGKSFFLISNNEHLDFQIDSILVWKRLSDNISLEESSMFPLL